MHHRLQLLGFVLVGCLIGACSSAPRGSELNVHVAASLSAVFEKLGDEFASQFPDVTVRFNFAGSSTIASQIQQGAPVDVVVVADSTNMDKLVTSGDVNRSDITDLAFNQLAILVATGNPLKIEGLRDLARADTNVVLCDRTQPCGKYAFEMLTAAAIDVEPASFEANAAAVVTRIANGDADAGIAYLTDGLVPNDGVDVVRIPSSSNVTTNYPISKPAKPSSGDADAVEAFVAMARGPVGDRLLTDAGFTLP